MEVEEVCWRKKFLPHRRDRGGIFLFVMLMCECVCVCWLGMCGCGLGMQFLRRYLLKKKKKRWYLLKSRKVHTHFGSPLPSLCRAFSAFPAHKNWFLGSN